MFKRLIENTNVFSARLIERSIRRAVRKQPRGAITFQNRIFNGQVDIAEVQKIKKMFNFGEIYLLHGTAMRKNGNAVILTGPRGAGKTTVMRNLSKKGKVTPIDDGIIILGRNRNGLFVVETGTLPWRNARSNVKRFSPIQGHQISRKGLKQKTTAIENMARHEGAISETIASFITRDKSSQTFTPIAIPIEKIIQVSSKDDLHLPMKLHGDKFETATEINFGVKRVNINPNQRRSKIIDQMREEVLRN